MTLVVRSGLVGEGGRWRRRVAKESLGLRASRSRGRWPARVALTLTRPADLSFSRPHRASCLSPPSLLPPPPHSDGPRFSSIFAGATRHGYIRSAHAFGGIIYVIEAVPPCAPPPRGEISTAGWKTRRFFPADIECSSIRGGWITIIGISRRVIPIGDTDLYIYLFFFFLRWNEILIEDQGEMEELRYFESYKWKTLNFFDHSIPPLSRFGSNEISRIWTLVRSVEGKAIVS